MATINRFKLAGGVFFWCLSITSLSHAQIESDNTLGEENSIVILDRINGMPSDRITGGARRKANLFHSFREFNIKNGQRVYFHNPQGVQNILSRVTGDNPSQIHGTLGVLGNANLFLINPNGIIFGRNARLDLQGSFLATTADSVLFNNYEFSAVNPEAPPLLTIKIPIGLQFGETPGTIINRSQVTSFSPEFGVVKLFGLKVKPERTLALIGGKVILEGGAMFASKGRIEIGSVTNSGLVDLTFTDKGFTLDYGKVEQFQDIKLSREAKIETTGNNDSDGIYLQGRNISIDGSQLINYNLGIDGTGGQININTFELEVKNGGGTQAVPNLPTQASKSGNVVKLTADLLLSPNSAGN